MIARFRINSGSRVDALYPSDLLAHQEQVVYFIRQVLELPLHVVFLHQTRCLGIGGSTLLIPEA